MMRAVQKLESATIHLQIWTKEKIMMVMERKRKMVPRSPTPASTTGRPVGRNMGKEKFKREGEVEVTKK